MSFGDSVSKSALLMMYFIIFGAEDRKQLRDSRWFVACIWINGECFSLFTCLTIYSCTHISSTIRWCDSGQQKSSALVGVRYPVIALYPCCVTCLTVFCETICNIFGGGCHFVVECVPC